MDAAELLRLTYEQTDDHAIILLDADGRTVAWMMGAQKIFGRTAEEMIRNRAEALATEDARKVLMFGTLAHELRNPLAVLTNAVELIELAHPGDPKFANLLTNASKFSPPGACIWVKGVLEADEMVVRVEDHGRGISPALLPRVFDLLSQAEPGKDERPQGLGLGLALVKEYVELHGGVVQVRSEGIGRGSEFTVRLPLRPKSDIRR